MSEPIPSRMRGLLLERYDNSLSAAIAGLRVVERAVPAVGRGQVLVRMEAAPCNPSDLLFLQGLYGSLKTLPTVPGWEGTGRVVASGGGWLGRWLRGKRVACGLQGDRDGTWAQYFVASATECIPLRRDVPTDQAACLIVNPLTAIGLLDTARRGRHPAAVHTAGASQLGRMLIALARDADYPMIHVVRREAQAELLRSLGAAHVLNSADPDFAARLEADCAKLRATIAFEAVAGPMTGTVLNAMPAGSAVCVYGDLSNEPCGGINPIDVIFREKTVSGFYLGKWLRSRGLLGSLR
ncbi:MAG: zinc-binding dehydrogenase, partial [Planctomycetes bacterium]|nr:zinc-binding dehydrogenase [Planctomycetota bacterium]